MCDNGLSRPPPHPPAVEQSESELKLFLVFVVSDRSVWIIFPLFILLLLLRAEEEKQRQKRKSLNQ